MSEMDATFHSTRDRPPCGTHIHCVAIPEPSSNRHRHRITSQPTLTRLSGVWQRVGRRVPRCRASVTASSLQPAGVARACGGGTCIHMPGTGRGHIDGVPSFALACPPSAVVIERARRRCTGDMPSRTPWTSHTQDALHSWTHCRESGSSLGPECGHVRAYRRDGARNQRYHVSYPPYVVRRRASYQEQRKAHPRRTARVAAIHVRVPRRLNVRVGEWTRWQRQWRVPLP